MSLYEPSIRSGTWSFVARRTRRFTTLSGWKEIGAGAFTMSSSIRMLSIKHQFDPESYRNEKPLPGEPGLPPVPALDEVERWRNAVEKPPEKTMAITRQVDVYITEEARRLSRNDVYDHVFSPWQKWLVVLLVTFVGIIPGLTSNIYLPVLGVVANDLQVSLDITALSITTYFFFQALAALIWGPISDSYGRKPTYIVSLSILIIANAVLTVSPNVTYLIVFRGVQGIASTVFMGSSVIHDVASQHENDDFLTFYQAVRNFIIVAGPFLGGLFTNYLNFRTIFIFLLSFSATALVVVVLLLPETLRGIVGNGSVRLTGIYKPLLYSPRIIPPTNALASPPTVESPPRVTAKAFYGPLLLLKEKDIILSLTFGATIFAIWNMVAISTVALFKTAFALTPLFLGLALLANGLGTIAGCTVIGNILNRDFRHASSLYKAHHQIPPSTALSRSPLPPDFPIKHIRLARLPYLVIIFLFSVSVYGFSLDHPVVTSRSGWILVPLILQFLIAFSANAICAIHETLIGDLFSDRRASTAVVSNVVRGMMSALGAGLVQKAISGVGAGSVFLALAMVVMVLAPLPVVQWFSGESRAARGVCEAVV